jgi:hypothetical protein
MSPALRARRLVDVSAAFIEKTASTAANPPAQASIHCIHFEVSPSSTHILT